MSNKPNIRFKQFTCDWEQHKLSSVADKVTEKNLDLAVQETFTNSAEYGIISQRDFFDHDISNSNNIGGYYVIQDEDFVYNPRISVTAPVGPINRNKLGRKGVMSPLYTVFRAHDIDTSFLEWYFKSSFWHSFMFFNGDSGARSDRFSIKDATFFEMPIPVPEIKEQQCIGAYLDKLNELIVLHQCKYSKYTDIRACLLQEMFCANITSSCPNTRFSEYSEEWKKMTLAKVVTPYTDYIPTPTDGYTRLGIRSHMKGTFYEYVAPSKQLGEKRLQRVKRDNFIVNIVFAWEHAIAVTTEEDEGKLVSHRFPQFSFNEGMYPRFFHYALNDERFRHHLWLASPSGAGRNKTLRIDEMMEYELRIPKYDEQKKIADFLTSLDELIELYDYRITKLQNIKAACLQGMFV